MAWERGITYNLKCEHFWCHYNSKSEGVEVEWQWYEIPCGVYVLFRFETHIFACGSTGRH